LEYLLIQAYQADRLTIQVNEKLVEGWVLFDTPCCANLGENSVSYVQAVVKHPVGGA
jgi:hypothetical protein